MLGTFERLIIQINFSNVNLKELQKAVVREGC